VSMTAVRDGVRWDRDIWLWTPPAYEPDEKPGLVLVLAWQQPIVVRINQYGMPKEGERPFAVDLRELTVPG